MFEFLIANPELTQLIIQNFELLFLSDASQIEPIVTNETVKPEPIVTNETVKPEPIVTNETVKPEEETSLFDEAATFIGQYILVLVIIGMVQASVGFNIMYEDLSDNQKLIAALVGLVGVHIIRNRAAYIDSMLPPLDKFLELVVAPDGSIRVSTKSPFRSYYTARSPMYPDKNGDVFRMYEWKENRLNCQLWDLREKKPKTPACQEFDKLYREWIHDMFYVKLHGEPSGYEHIIDIWYEIKKNAEPRYYRLLRFFLEDLQMFFDFGYQLF